MLRDFVAIDFETANEQASSICSVGVVIVRQGEVVDKFYSLVSPEPDYFNYFCQRVHGITAEQVAYAPVFPEVWAEVEQRIADAFPGVTTVPFVAHNARFDEGCLKAAFRVYQMDYPEYLFLDTLTASRRQFGRQLPNHQLQTVAEACGYDLQHHHHALADAEACAAIALFII